MIMRKTYVVADRSGTQQETFGEMEERTLRVEGSEKVPPTGPIKDVALDDVWISRQEGAKY